MSNVIALRTRKERGADDLLAAAEGMKASIEGLEDMARVAIRKVIERGMRPEDVARVRTAVALVIEAGDELALLALEDDAAAQG